MNHREMPIVDSTNILIILLKKQTTDGDRELTNPLYFGTQL